MFFLRVFQVTEGHEAFHPKVKRALIRKSPVDEIGAGIGIGPHFRHFYSLLPHLRSVVQNSLRAKSKKSGVLFGSEESVPFLVLLPALDPDEARRGSTFPEVPGPLVTTFFFESGMQIQYNQAGMRYPLKPLCNFRFPKLLHLRKFRKAVRLHSDGAPENIPYDTHDDKQEWSIRNFLQPETRERPDKENKTLL